MKLMGQVIIVICIIKIKEIPESRKQGKGESPIPRDKCTAYSINTNNYSLSQLQLEKEIIFYVRLM